MKSWNILYWLRFRNNVWTQCLNGWSAIDTSRSYLVLYVAAKHRRVGQNLCRKLLATTFLDPKIAKESISVVESCHRSRAGALWRHFQTISISNSQQPDHACMNFHSVTQRIQYMHAWSWSAWSEFHLSGWFGACMAGGQPGSDMAAAWLGTGKSCKTKALLKNRPT